MKNIQTEMKNALQGINNGADEAEHQSRDLNGKKAEKNPNQKNNNKRIKK